MRTIGFILAILWGISSRTVLAGQPSAPHWPDGQEDYRVVYLDQIRCSDLTPSGGFFKKLTRLIGGGVEADAISLPFDIVAVDGSLFLVCQNIPMLVEIDRNNKSFKLHANKKYPFEYPVSLCHAGEGVIFVSDTKTNMIYRFADGDVQPLITSGLTRPTGVAVIASLRTLVVSDTGEQNVKLFDFDGNLLRVIDNVSDSIQLFNFPTFAATLDDRQILINDALNYQIKRFGVDGHLAGSFGAEGEGPGRFARPKGIAVDSDDNIWVVDNLADNVQVFDTLGRLLLEIGSPGQDKGQFWSPAGIDIDHDTIYVADTFNDRIQIFYYRGERP